MADGVPVVLVRGDDGVLWLEDLGSANGTRVNGERIDAPCFGRVDWQPGASPDTLYSSLGRAVDLMAAPE